MVTDPIKFVYLVGDGVTTDFSYAYNGTVGFDADVADDVKAAILNPDGTRDTSPNFAVMQDTYGNFIGKIRFAVAPVANAIIYIYRATPQTQETEYKTSSGFDAQNVEKDFDKLTKLAQETASHTRNKTLQLDMFQEAVLKLILTSSENQNQMLFIDFENLTFKFTDFTKGQAVITPAAGSDDKTDLMLRHQTDNETGSVYLAFSIDQGKTWNPMNFAEIKRIVDEANENAAQALENSEQAVDTANDAKAIAQNAATDAENAVQTATNATDIANAANATAESAKTTATNASTKADAAVSTANSALQKANTAMVQSSDALADAAVSLENSEQAVATANAAKNTADGIDGKATNALANSEQAVSTANDAKAVADGIDAKAQEALDNSETAVSTANEAKQATAGKADKATTLAGYGITDAYTKTEVDAKVSSVYRFRGSVATYANLPTTGQVIGDVWNVEDTGANYAWSGTEWDKLSETVDLTPYLTKAEASSTYATQSALAEVSTVAETAQSTADKADSAAEVAQQTANVAGTTAAQALSGLNSKVDKAQGAENAGKILGIGSDGNVALVDGASGTGRNIGDIFWTTRTDSALNGAVEANGAQYNFADVNGGDNNVQALLESGALPSVTIAEFDAMVTNQGGCDSFGYGTAELTLYPVYIFTGMSEGIQFYSNVLIWSSAQKDSNDVLQGVKLYDKNTYQELTGWYVKDEVMLGLYYIYNSEDERQDPNGYMPEGNDTVTLPTGGEFQSTTYFKVPKKVGRVLVRSQKPNASNNYTWYNVYSDGWCEQGGYINTIDNNSNATISFSIEMANTGFTLSLGQAFNLSYIYEQRHAVESITNRRTTGVSIKNARFGGSTSAGISLSWQVVGYANSAEYAPSTWDYQNIQVLRPMVQLFNGSTDSALATCTSVLSDIAGLKQATDGIIDYVVESQEPTSGNGYTWYKLFKSGRVEQGGIQSGNKTIGSGSEGNLGTISLPIEMLDTSYVAISQCEDSYCLPMKTIKTNTTTTFIFGAYSVNRTLSNISWQVTGMSAQGSN